MYSLRVGRHWQVRDQLPDDGRPALRRVEFLGMDDLEFLMPIYSLLSDRRPDDHGGMPDRQHRAMVIALRVPEPHLMGAA